MLHELGTRGSHARSVQSVILFVRQTEPTLTGIEDDHVAVALVRPAAKAEKSRQALPMEFGDLTLRVIDCIDLINACKLGVERMGNSLLDRGLVHTGRVEIADHLDVASRGGLFFLGLLEDIVKHIAIALAEHIKAAPSGLRW